MNKKMKDEAKEILDGFEDKETQEEANKIKVQESDPLFSLKNVLYEFFERRLQIIAKEEEFKEIVKNAIIEKIENGDMNQAQLMSLYETINSQSTFATNSILDIFKPGKEGHVSPLVQPEQQGDSKDPTLRDFGKLSTDEADSLHTLSAVLEEIKKGIGEKKNEENEE